MTGLSSKGRSPVRRVLQNLLLTLLMVLSGPSLLAANQSIAILDVTVIPMDAPRQLEHQTVLISDGRITAMGSAEVVAVPPGAQEIDGRGKFVMPGLSDMHAHIYGGNTEAEREAVEPIARNQLLLYAASGITLLRDAAGTPAHFTYNANIEKGSWIGPDLFVASPIFEGERNVWDFSVKVVDPAVAMKMVEDYAEAGYWGLKVYHTVSPEVFAAINESAQRVGLPVMGHVPFDVGIDAALESGQSSVEHLRGYDFDGVPVENLWEDGGRSKLRFGSWNRMSEARKQELVQKTVLNQVWNTPTLAVNRLLFDQGARDTVAAHPRFARVHPMLQGQIVNSSELDAIFPPESKTALRDAYPVMLDFIHRLSKAGAGLLIGTDSAVPGYVPGFSVIDEIQNFVDAGLSTFEALEAATIGPARYLGVDDDRGTVAVGKRADLILLDADPLAAIDALWTLDGVFLAGHWHSLPSLEAALDATLPESTP